MGCVAFHPEAEAYFFAAARYYEEQADRLGLGFIFAVERTCQRLSALPQSGHPFGSRLRLALVPGFPYSLIYCADSSHLAVVAVAHLNRRPGYWRTRTRVAYEPTRHAATTSQLPGEVSGSLLALDLRGFGEIGQR